MNPRTRRNRRLHRRRTAAENLVRGAYYKVLAQLPIGERIKKSEREAVARKVRAAIRPFLTHKHGRVRDFAAAMSAALGTEAP